MERWGLRAIQENVDDWTVINGWNTPEQWTSLKSDFCKHFNCILELTTDICPLEGEGGREIFGHDGLMWLAEIEHAHNYMKTTVEEMYEGYKNI